MDNELDRRITRFATLGEPIRRALYRFVVRRARPVSREEAAEGVGVPRHVAKFHLDRLGEDGLLEVEYRRPPGRSGPGAGRPAKLYRRASDEITVSLPDRRYELAAHLMATAISAAESTGASIETALGDAAAAAGHSLGEQVLERSSAAGLVGAVCDVLDQAGYEPSAEAGVVTLVNCPFHRLAREFAGLVCGMNLDIMRGLAAELPGDQVEARLEPAPDRCCVRLHALGPGDTVP